MLVGANQACLDLEFRDDYGRNDLRAGLLLASTEAIVIAVPPGTVVERREREKGEGMIRMLFGSSLVLACLCLSALAGNATSDRSKINTMRFELRSDSLATRAGREAVGQFDPTRPPRFALQPAMRRSRSRATSASRS